MRITTACKHSWFRMIRATSYATCMATSGTPDFPSSNKPIFGPGPFTVETLVLLLQRPRGLGWLHRPPKYTFSNVSGTLPDDRHHLYGPFTSLLIVRLLWTLTLLHQFQGTDIHGFGLLVTFVCARPFVDGWRCCQSVQTQQFIFNIRFCSSICKYCIGGYWERSIRVVNKTQGMYIYTVDIVEVR